MSDAAQKLNQQIIKTNLSKLEDRTIFPGIQERLGGDPTETANRLFSYVRNLLVWQKELVLAQTFELLAGRNAYPASVLDEGKKNGI